MVVVLSLFCLGIHFSLIVVVSPKIVNLGSAKVDMYFERKKFGGAAGKGSGGGGAF